MMVEIEELESLLGPDDLDVDFRRILEEARGNKGCAICEIFSAEGPSEFSVVSTRWDQHQKWLSAPWRQYPSSSSHGRSEWQAGLEEQRVAWSSSEGKVMGGSRRSLGKKCRYKSGH